MDPSHYLRYNKPNKTLYGVSYWVDRKIGSLECGISSNETNLRYLACEPESENKNRLIELNKKGIKDFENQIEKLLIENGKAYK